MQDLNKIPPPAESAKQPERDNARMTGPARSRRHALLKGLGRGSAIIAAVTPIKTLALTQSVTVDGKMCTASGVGSAVHSTATNLSTCNGLSPGYYKTASHWPYYKSTTTSKGSTTSTVISSTFAVGPKTTVNEMFGDGTSPGSKNDTAFSAVFNGGSNHGMFYILQNEADTAEFHWIAALLNAVSYAKGGWPAGPSVYPYSPTEIVSLYATNPVAGLAFIKLLEKL